MIRQFIPDIFKTIVEKTQTALQVNNPLAKVYFAYGHYNEVANLLSEKDRGTNSKDKKYPLIWLVMDYVEQYGKDLGEYCLLSNLQFLIATPTQPAHDVAKRMTVNFIPVLYPIYDEFLNQLALSGAFNLAVVKKIEHEKIDRPYWGNADSIGNGQANLFNDFIDAIQIRGMKLSIRNRNCESGIPSLLRNNFSNSIIN